uniref:Fe2OG dioxygenase domain-containing protein n=1 Tax=Globisporangium ultimum (strain ATCC 200006 / CBS 805.95 / DAOM BR144) TaxID=431595 RepID=K3WLA9_GLOUD
MTDVDALAANVETQRATADASAAAPVTTTTSGSKYGPPLELIEYVADDQPSAFLKFSMSRRISEKLITEDKLRPFLLSVARERLADSADIIDDDVVRRIEYGKSAKKTILVEFANAKFAAPVRETLHNQACALLQGRAMYVDFAMLRKEKEVRDAFLRVMSISRIRALEDPSTRIPGLIILPEFISKEDEVSLLEMLERDDGAHWKNTVKARQVQHFGYEFSYETRCCDANQPLEPMPPAMDKLTKQIPASIMDTPDQITVNEYKPGQGIAAHIDTHSAFTNAIASLSLENEIVMEFRHPDGRMESVLCQPRSLLVMTGPSRYEWTHAIPPRMFDVIDGEKVDRKRRVSITFRKIQETDCTCDFPVQCDSERDQNGAVSSPQTAGSNDEKLFPTHVEQQYVHEFYETVASHFSSTRYNPWPRVAAFVRSLEPGSLIADIGCGNGKYMKCVDAASQNMIVGGDRSSNLVKICKESDLNVMVCDAMTVPIRSGSCDAALSIAVLHHLSTLHHRLAAVKELIRVLRVGGRGVIYAWAHEQQVNSKRKFEGPKQDFMVPWNLDARFAQKDNNNTKNESGDGTAIDEKESSTKGPIVVQRYCHMFKEGELEQLVELAGNAIVEEQYYDESNWAVVLRRVS